MTRAVARLGGYFQSLKVPPPSAVATCALGALAAGLTAIYVWVGQQQDDLDAHIPEFIGLLLLAGILYVIAVFLVERFRLGRAAMMVILAGTVLFRLVLLPTTPSLSDDVYRYQWDGRVQRAHLNPYLAVPSSPELSWLLNPDNPEPPGIDTPTIYPPLSELVYRTIETVAGYKLVSTILDLACVGLLWLLLAAMELPLQRVLAYAWNPAVLLSFAMSGHFDPLTICMLLAALFFLVKNRPKLSIAALALAFLSKLFPVLLLPAFLKRVRPAYAGIFALLVFAFYLPFSGAGLHLLDWLLGEEAGRAAVVKSCARGRSTFGFANRLSLVFHLVDPVFMFLPKRCMVTHERHKCVGLHSPNRRRIREFSAYALS